VASGGQGVQRPEGYGHSHRRGRARCRRNLGAVLGLATPALTAAAIAPEPEPITALALRGYEPAFVPGLLQTEAYARALFKAGGMPPMLLEDKVAERMSRQAILDRESPPEIFLVLDEMVLRRVCGGHSVMGEQIEHLLTQIERPNVHVGIMTVDQGIYPGLQGGFVIADLPSGARAGYIDNQLDAQILETHGDIVRLSMRWDGLTSEALPSRQTLDVLREVAKSWT
jgi:hypothetical protein